MVCTNDWVAWLSSYLIVLLGLGYRSLHLKIFLFPELLQPENTMILTSEIKSFAVWMLPSSPLSMNMWSTHKATGRELTIHYAYDCSLVKTRKLRMNAPSKSWACSSFFFEGIRPVYQYTQHWNVLLFSIYGKAAGSNNIAEVYNITHYPKFLGLQVSADYMTIIYGKKWHRATLLGSGSLG